MSSQDKTKIIEDAWLGIELDDSKLFDPVAFVMDGDPDSLHLRLSWLMSRPEYFSFVCKQIFSVDLLPVQALMLEEIWNRKFPMLIASRGFGKSFILSLYSMMRALLMPARKIVIVGAAFRQSKVLFEYMDTIWKNSPLLRDMCDSRSGPRRDVDRCVMHINNSTVTCLPLGDGSKIRGQRANDIVADEFASIPREIFENVVAGFAAVSSTPIENVKLLAAQKKAKELGVKSEEKNKERSTTNQIVLSGTAYYDFNHFAEYWKKWKEIINSKGQKSKLEELFGGEVPEEFNWQDYSIIRIPYELLPKGFMDEGQVARSKATIHSGIYQMEFGACFSTDSQGFFKRSLIESCVVKKDGETKISLPSCGDVFFEAMLRGDPEKKYIIGIDPASEVDNFSVVVLEDNVDHGRIVYCWTTTRSKHKELVKSGLVSEIDFYSFCARKIRDLMKIFPCRRIAMDAQGGGIAIMEALHDPDKIKEGELPIWEVINDDKAKDTDAYAGLHILEMCQFAKYDWLSEANHGMRKDFEDKVLLFPFFDSISLGLALNEDSVANRFYDTLEDCVMEIEELKNELSIIMITQTTAGRDRWDTPEVKLAAGRKDRLRKDRYSALLMANMAARTLRRTPETPAYEVTGDFARGPVKSKEEGPLYVGPAWWTEKIRDIY